MQPSTARANTTDPLERARRAAAKRYPGAEIELRSWRGCPVLIAREGSVIHLIRPRPAGKRRKSRK